MRGMTRSVTTMAGRNEVTFWRPSCPSSAESARKPHVRISSVRPTRVAGSSSTTSTRSTTGAGCSRTAVAWFSEESNT